MYNRLLAAVLLLLSIVVLVAPVAAFSCSVQISSVKYPDAVNLGQPFSVTGTMTATCQQPEGPLSGRADLFDSSTYQQVASSAIPIGYVTGAVGTINGEFTLNAVAPSTAMGWYLTIIVSLWFSGVAFASTSYSIVIQVGSTGVAQPTTQAQVLVNGGFESGLLDWQVQGGGGRGYATISTGTVHSGQGALMLGLYPPLPGSNMFVAVIESASETVPVQNIRDLTVTGWYRTQIDSPNAYPQLAVTVGGVTVNYPERYCPTWCQVTAYVGQDIKNQYGVGSWSTVFQSSNQMPLSVKLEIVGRLPFEDNQFTFWDDVEATASIVAQANITSLTSLSTVSSQVTQAASTSVVAAQPSTTTQTVTQTTTMQFAPSPEQLYGSLAVILALGLIAETFVLLRQRARKRKQPGTTNESSHDPQ
jgi:hypothetical protein